MMKEATTERLLSDCMIAYNYEKDQAIIFKNEMLRLMRLTDAQRFRYPWLFVAGMMLSLLGILLASQAFYGF